MDDLCIESDVNMCFEEASEGKQLGKHSGEVLDLCHMGLRTIGH